MYSKNWEKKDEVPLTFMSSNILCLSALYPVLGLLKGESFTAVVFLISGEVVSSWLLKILDEINKFELLDKWHSRKDDYETDNYNEVVRPWDVELIGQ